jgi:RNA polymerase sigma factor (sigma-70 family)
VESAFAEHRVSLFRYVARLTGSSDVAEDVVQETFMRLAIRPPARLTDLRPWLFTVATNLSHDEDRRTRRQRRLLAQRATEQPVGDPPADPSRHAEQEDLVVRVRQVLGKLNRRDRTALLLRAEGFSHREIGEALDTTTKSVGTLIARALERLAAELDLDPEDA